MADSLTHALPYPIRKARFTLPLPFRTSAGTPTDPTTPDTEFSTDGGATFSDCAEEITTGGANGWGYLTLTGAETDNAVLLIAAKSANCVTTPAWLHPRNLPTISSGTLSAGSSTGGTLGTILAYDITNCFIRTTGGTGGGGTGGANNQCRRILTYNVSTGVFTCAAFETTPDATTTYDILLPESITLGELKTLNPTTPGNTLDVTATGEAGIDWANIGGKTTTNALTGTTIATTQQVDVNTIKTQVVTCAAGVTIRADVGAAAAPGSANGMLIGGSNAATTFSGLTTGALSCTTITASGAVAFQSTFAVTTSTSLAALSCTTLTASGAVALQSTLTVTGATTLTGAVTSTNASNDVRLGSTERNNIATALLKLDWTGITGEASRSVLNALRFLRNVWTIAAGVLTVKKEDDTTTAWTGPVQSVAVDSNGFVTLTSAEHTLIAGDVESGLTAQGYTTGRAPNLDNLDATVSSRLAPTVGGNTLDVTATGGAGIDWSNIENPATVVDLSGTTIAVTQQVDIAASEIPLKKNTALNAYEFMMVLSSDHVTPATGLTVTGEVSINGAVFTNLTNAVTEVGSGIYKVNLAAADTNGDTITFKFTAATADQTTISHLTQ